MIDGGIIPMLNKYLDVAPEVRQALDEGRFEEFRCRYSDLLDRQAPKD